MAFIFKDWRPRIAMRMAKGDKELMRWLNKATFAKTSNGYWLAWHQGDNVDRVALLPPEHPEGEECKWLESWGNSTIETFIDYVESGEYEEEKNMVLNLQIQNPETGEWE